MPKARSPKPKVQSLKPKATAYLHGLGILARRECSEAQVRQRLARKGHDADAIEDAIERLRTERAIDDERAAMAIARTETAVRRRGKLRVRQQIEQAGIAPATARLAVDSTFEDVDEDTLLDAALAKRLRGRERIADMAEFQKLYRYLIRQGFESDRIMRLLRRRQPKA
jgi:regulatory protein